MFEYFVRLLIFLVAAAGLGTGVALFFIATRDESKFGQNLATGMIGVALLTVIALGLA